MLGPVVPYAIKGAVWYQGESNAGQAEQYRSLLPLMIKDWRARWDQGDFPFGVVQLANFMKPEEVPADPAWAHLRDAQRHAAVSDPNTGLVVITDIGEANDIHPRNKQEVGRRLARWALAEVYRQNDISMGGPEYLDYTTEGNKMVLRFKTNASNLKVHDEWKLKGFIIAGADRKWHHAEATIQGKDLVAVWSPQVAEPQAVRYAWANNPNKANLVNDRQLPAGPFRTDNW
jgi:sialate O-acetylesterase